MKRLFVSLFLVSIMPGCVSSEDEPLAFETQEVTSLACAGIPTTGIEDYSGLVGYYFRGAPFVDGELVSLQVLTLDEGDEWIGVGGSYYSMVRRDGLYRVESGDYVAVPNNPAIGPVLAFDPDRDGNVDELYWVLGATRNALGSIDRLCLGKSRPDGSGSPFAMTRLGW